MSLIFAADLLRKYNKDLKTPQEEKTPQIGAWSYGNMYDALYDRFSQNKNFNMNLWHDSIKAGEQDTYLAFLEQNKNNTMGKEFYDPQYYDYENMILELSLPVIKDTNKEERFAEVWDARTQSYVEEKIGDMSDREYVKYQLNQIKDIRTSEIKLELEKNRKESMGWLALTANAIGAILPELGEGVLSGLAGIIDVLPAFVYASIASNEESNWLDTYVDYYGEKGLTALEKKYVRGALDEWERTSTYIKDINGNFTPVGKYLAGISNSIGMMVPAILINVVAPGPLGMTAFYASIYGNNLNENALNPATKDSPSWMKIGNAAIKAGVEVVIEYTLDKVLGGTLSNELLGLSGKGLRKETVGQIVGQIGKTAGLKYLMKSGLQEGLEEFLQDFSTNLVDQFTGMIYEGYQHTGVNFQTLIDSFMIGFASSIFMTGGAVMRNSIVDKVNDTRNLKIDEKIKAKTLTLEEGQKLKKDNRSYIENTEGDLQEIKGFGRLAWSSMIQDFSNAIKTLEKNKMSMNKNIELGKEIHGGIMVMSQLYKSFSTERIANSERLLQRVIKAEQSKMNKDDIIKLSQKNDMETFTKTMFEEFNDMIGNVGSRYMSSPRFKKVFEAIHQKLKDGNVTEIISATDKKGTRYAKDPVVTELEEKMRIKHKKIYDKYDWVFTTDGNVAIEQDGLIFLPEAWEENYETNEIYKFLAQEQIFDFLKKDKELSVFLKEVIKYNQEFTGRKVVTEENALMDLLFNKTVFQHFLLSHKGENVNKFSDIIFRIHDRITSLIETNPNLDAERKAYLEQIYEQIKQTMREPTIKAIINWKMNPQLIGADSILTVEDRKFINWYQASRKTVTNSLKSGKIDAAYERRTSVLKEHSRFNKEEKNIVEKGLKDDATDNDRLQAILLLDLADERYTTIDFQQKFFKEKIKNIKDNIENILSAKTDGSVDDIIEKIIKDYRHLDNKKDIIKSLQSLLDNNLSTLEKINKFEEIYPLINDRITVFENSLPETLNRDKGIFAMPIKAINIDDDIASTQFRADVINEFKEIYGIDAESLFQGNHLITKEIEQEMKVLKVDNSADFVMKKLEIMLGDKYVVTPKYRVDNDTLIIEDFEIVKRIPADELLPSFLLDGDLDTQNKTFRFMFGFDNETMYIEKFLTDKNKKYDISLIKDWTVTLSTDISSHTNFEYTTIFINVNDTDLVHTFVHELNHVIQDVYHFTRGGNTRLVSEMPDFMKYIYENHKDAINYLLRGKGYDTAEKMKKEDPILKNAIAYIGYRLIQGELWAEYYMHNGKLVRSYIMSQAHNGKSYIVSPNGKHKFLMPFGKTEKSNKETIKEKPSALFTKNAMENTFDNILSMRHNDDVRDTYHTRLTRMSNIELTRKILAPNSPNRYGVRLNEIILNPEQYLSQEMLDKIKTERGEINEGTTYNFLKTWYEDNVTGVSIDREDNTHTYIFVDDDAFDDLLTRELFDKRPGKESDLVKKYTSTDGIKLDKFYKTNEVKKLFDIGDIVVIANDNVYTETRNTKNNPVIYINTRNTNNSQFINKLNHEFRHLLQLTFTLETGFTPDFKVTSDMLSDLKKHVPEIFKNVELRTLAKNAGKEIEVFIAQRFIYYMITGEQNAYGFKSEWLNSKPFFVTTEAGRPTIFMGWYNAKTGEGRYITEFLAARADDENFFILPSVSRKPKYKSKTEKVDEITGKTKIVYTYDERRDFQKSVAKDTNLKYFMVKGKLPQMDPRLQNFIKATTGHDEEIKKVAPELLDFITSGSKKPLQKFNAWFRKVDLSKIDGFLFDLINKHMFKNDTIQTARELEQIINYRANYIFAAIVILRRRGLSDDIISQHYDVKRFLETLDLMKDGELGDEIRKFAEKLNYYRMFDEKTEKWFKVKLGQDLEIEGYMRVFTMQYFNGTLAGAFYTARTLRYNIRKMYEREHYKISTNQSKESEKNSKNTIDDFLSKENNTIPETREVSNDIISLYDLDFGMSNEKMIEEIIGWARIKYKKEKKIVSETALEKLALRFFELETEDLTLRYQQLRDEQNTNIPNRIDITNTDKDFRGQLRINIVSRIKNRANRLMKYVREGKVVWSNLPKDIQEMFELVTVTNKNKKYKMYKLKPEVYSVGKGAIEGKGSVARDVSKISAIATRLEQETIKAHDNVYATKETSTYVKKLERKNFKLQSRQISKVENNISNTKFRETKIKIETKNRTPNNFVIISGKAMPIILRKIFDVSFTEMANTEVQFISKDKNGNLYEKGTKEYDAALEHEVKNWNIFYESVREQLLELNRTDVLDIVEFLQGGITTVDGPADKLAAFQIFVLGYIVAGARQNFNNWNFSDAETAIIEKLYESKASTHASGLNAVGQMIKVIDPIKKIRQRMLEKYNISDEELVPFFDSIDNLQEELDIEKRKELAVDVEKEMLKIKDLMLEREVDPKTALRDKFGKPIIETAKTVKRGFGKRWYQKLKAARYTFMLSSPLTGARNLTSNVIITALNKLSDFIGKVVFIKKGYRKGQWNIAGTKMSNEVKTFIEQNVKNSELFNLLYDGNTKYDNNAKNVKNQKELFITMIVSSLERRYAAEHKFDSPTANFIAKKIAILVSDRKFIKLATSKYLGKILTIEVANGNIDLSKGLSNEVLNIFANAVIEANMEYMHKRSFLSDIIDGQKQNHPIAYEILNWWQPFMNSSFNWFQEALKFTPPGLLVSIIRMGRIEQQITKLNERRARGEIVSDSRTTEHHMRRDIGKGIFGLFLTGLGIWLSLTGLIKIDEEEDKFYVIVGDVKFDISNIFANSSVLIGASLAQFGRSKPGTDDKYGFDDTMKYVFDTMLEGFLLKDLLDKHKWNSSTFENLLTESEGILRSLVPQIVQLMIRSFNNEEIRYSAGIKGMWERWLNSWVPTQPFGSRKINPYTGEVETKYSIPVLGELLGKGLLGPKIFFSNVSDIEAFAKDYGINKTELTGEITINGDTFIVGDKEILNKKYGELNKKSLAEIQQGKYSVQMLDKTFKTLGWNQMSDLQQARVIDRIMIQNGEIAKIFMWTQTGHKYYANDTLWLTLRQLGINKNVYKGDKDFVL